MLQLRRLQVSVLANTAVELKHQKHECLLLLHLLANLQLLDLIYLLSSVSSKSTFCAPAS